MELLTVPNDQLRLKCDGILMSNPSLNDNIGRMVTLMVANKGCGFAAPQMGWMRRVFIVSESGEPKDLRVFINPKLSDGEGHEYGVEGCLSIPNKQFLVPRFTSIRVVAQGLGGEKIDEVYRGGLARIVQHEYDHLDGLLIDRFEEVLDVTR